MGSTIHLNLSPSVHREIKKIADELGMPASSLVRLIVRWWLKQVKEGKLNPEEMFAELTVSKSEEHRRMENAEETSKQGRVSDAVLEKLIELHQAIEEMRRSFEDRLVDLESQIFELQEELRKLKARVHRLEDAYEDIVNPVHVEQVPARR